MKIKKNKKDTVAPVSTAKAETKGKTKVKAEVKTSAPVAEVKAVKADAKPSIHKGATTGMRVMQYQDHTLSIQGKRKLSDEDLAADWQAEFPHTRCQFTPAIVAGVRRLFNAGKHGSQQVMAPGDGVSRYEDGKPVAERKRAAKADAKSAAA